ncbi:MAG: hypothetical protein D3908_07775, partial [Candidatus Electrothrix sp. AUS4]|nr:hypothetical protein [Candidatus Electrothrix sp. AUS4]
CHLKNFFKLAFLFPHLNIHDVSLYPLLFPISYISFNYLILQCRQLNFSCQQKKRRGDFSEAQAS